MYANLFPDDRLLRCARASSWHILNTGTHIGLTDGNGHLAHHIWYEQDIFREYYPFVTTVAKV